MPTWTAEGKRRIATTSVAGWTHEKLSEWAHGRKPRGYGIRTYSQREPDGRWFVHVDVDGLYDPPESIAGAETLTVTEGFRIGPWPSRQVARRELRGGVRALVLGVIRKLKAEGATIERFDCEADMPDVEREALH